MEQVSGAVETPLDSGGRGGRRLEAGGKHNRKYSRTITVISMWTVDAPRGETFDVFAMQAGSQTEYLRITVNEWVSGT